MNRAFESPGVLTHPGRKDMGAEITTLGEKLAAQYRSIELSASNAARRPGQELVAALDWSFERRIGAHATAAVPSDPEAQGARFFLTGI